MPANLQRSGEGLVLFALIAICDAIVRLARGERSLGDLIRLVHVHVAFRQAGMFGFSAAGFRGMAAKRADEVRPKSWTQTVAWVAFTLFLLDGLASASPSLLIWLTFPSLTVLVFLMGVWLVWYSEKPQRS